MSMPPPNPKDSTLRAQYLLICRGWIFVASSRPAGSEFLMQQLSWREELEALREAADPEAQIRCSNKHQQ
jgi:DnaJ-domain-containing protein 1